MEEDKDNLRTDLKEYFRAMLGLRPFTKRYRTGEGVLFGLSTLSNSSRKALESELALLHREEDKDAVSAGSGRLYLCWYLTELNGESLEPPLREEYENRWEELKQRLDPAVLQAIGKTLPSFFETVQELTRQTVEDEFLESRWAVCALRANRTGALDYSQVSRDIPKSLTLESIVHRDLANDLLREQQQLYYTMQSTAYQLRTGYRQELLAWADRVAEVIRPWTVKAKREQERESDPGLDRILGQIAEFNQKAGQQMQQQE